MDKLELKYPVGKMILYVVSAMLALWVTASSIHAIRTEGGNIFPSILSLTITVTNLGMAIRESKKYARPVILDKEGILHGKVRYFWSSISSCSLEKEQENKLVLTFKETYTKPVSIDLSNYSYEKWDLVEALENFPPSSIFKYEDES